MRRALVLAWGGRAVPEGCDRAIRVVNRANTRTDRIFCLMFADDYTVDGTLGIARECERRGFGTVVVLGE